MDIHRCRFVPYRPQSINTLAFSHKSNPKQRSPQDLRLALGRENGDVEIWNPAAGSWVQEKILRGGQDRTIEQLVWTQDLNVDSEGSAIQFDDGPLRLFSSGGSPSVTEWDLATGQQKRHAEGNFGDIWCFAAQPQWKRSGKEPELSRIAAAPSQLLAAGCRDGSVVLFATADDTLQFLRVLAPSGKKYKVISITWRDRDTVVAGYENSMIRIIDVPSRTITRTMSLGRSIDGTNSVVVWTIKCLPDGTILSGDSSGELKIWDAKTLSLTQRLKAHDADLLDLAFSTNGDTIFTASVDRKIVVFKQLPDQNGQKRAKWQRMMHRRFHQHDVKALAAFEAKGMSVLLSGGMDTVPIVMPLRKWESEYHRSLSHLPQHPQMSCSNKAQLMLTWWDRDILIWQLPKSPVIDTDYSASNEFNHQLLAKIELNSEENITSAHISEDGRLVVAATVAGVKLFQIRKRSEAGDIEIRTRPIDLPSSIRSFGASEVGFSPDSKWLATVRTSGLITMVKLVPGQTAKEKPQLYPQVVKLGRKQGKNERVRSLRLGDYPRSINCISWSSDSRILATGDLSGTIDTWVLEGHEDIQDLTSNGFGSDSDGLSDSDSDSDSDDETDSRVIHGQKWIRNPSGLSLPQLSTAILALSFKPHAPSQSSTSAIGLHATRHNPHPVSHELPPTDTKLVAVTLSHQLVEFDVMSGTISDWSRRNPSSCLPQSLMSIKDRLMGVFWDCNLSLKRERLWLYGPTWLFMLDMTRDLDVVNTQEKVGQIGDYDVREPVSSSAIVKQPMDQPATPQLSKKRKRNTGAGDTKKPNEGRVPTTVSQTTDAMDLDTGLLSPASDGEDDEEDMDIDDAGALTRLRRGSNSYQARDEETADAADEAKQTVSKESRTQSSPAHHAIYRYRSIFGIIALQPQPPTDPNTYTNTSADDESTNSQNQQPKHLPITTTSQLSNLEIIIIERPMYDVDLLPRFDGNQDWST